ncbi:MAG: acyl-CoA dehydrogenase [Gammaproteobacteria bacterium]|nr:acyl-CoA dehydrogenase [Gammaproteobacteria bacterium]
MAVLTWIVAIMAGLWVLAYLRLPLLVSSAVLAAGLAGITLLIPVSPVMLYGAWTIFIVIVIPLNIPFLRRWLISDKVFALFRKILPKMSQTEREALEAGSVWWDAELFSGRPRWQNLFKTPEPALSAEEQAFLDGPVDELCRMIDDWQINHELMDLSPEIWAFLKQHKFFGMIIPTRYGGLGFSALAHSSVVMKIASRSITAAVTVMVPNSLGPAELLLHYGTDEQRDHYLPKLASGEDVPCFALTGPEAGSDAGAMPDNGVVCKGVFEGKDDVLGIRLNWDKRYITLGPVATLLGLAFKLYDPDHLLGDQEELGITVALIPVTTPGITIGRRHNPLNIMFQNGPNQGKDVFIPIEWVIGGRARVGEGWRMLMESLAAGRSISLPALSTGAGKVCSRSVGAYARIRRQFNMPIGKFEGVEEALARIGGFAYMMDAARTLTAGAVDRGEKPSVLSAIVKYQLTEHMRKVVNDAMDIRGGSGISMGPLNVLGRTYQALPISITVEGANILTRSLIIYGQGAIRCHPYVFSEMQAVANEDRQAGARDFDRALWGHIGFTISNAARSFLLGITSAVLVPRPVGGISGRFCQHFSRISAAFAFCSDVAMLVLGGSLKRREKLSGRFADVLSQMYLASAVLKRFHDQGSPPDDLPFVKWYCYLALYRCQEALDGVIRNFPSKPVGWIMRLVVFPVGKWFFEPGDRLGHKIATTLLEPSEARDRLTEGVFVSNDANDAMGRVEVALPKVIAAEEATKKLRKADIGYEYRALKDLEGLIDEALKRGVIDASEAQLVRAGDEARRSVVRVDDFPQDMN